MTNILNIFAAGVIGLSATSGAALATDVSKGTVHHNVVTAPSAPDKTYWDGFYAGGSLGMGSTNYKFSGGASLFNNPIVGFGLPDLGGSGALLGLQAGYNWRATNDLVVGVQLDGNMTSITNTANFNITALVAGEYSIRPRHEFALTGRVGYVVAERTMVYGLAGVSRGSFRGNLSASLLGNPVLDTSYSFNRTGWTAGVGISTMMTDNISLGLEYRYTDYGRHTLFNETIGPVNADFGFTTRMQTARASVNYHF